MDNGWIKIHRKTLDWEWWEDDNIFRVFMYCLLRANFEDKKWRGIVIKRGEFITSRENISQALSGKDSKVSVQQVRTALNKLKLTGELTIKTTNRYSLIKVNNYYEYQVVNQQVNSQVTSKQPTDNQQVTIDKKLKKEKNIKNTHTGHSPDGSLGEKDFNTSLVDEKTKQKRKSSAKKKKDLEDFDKFWIVYPRKAGKGGARKAFAKALSKTTADILISAVEKQKYQEQWTKDDGTYIPHPATWLNQECWEDEVGGGYSQKESDRDIDWSKVELPDIN